VSANDDSRLFSGRDGAREKGTTTVQPDHRPTPAEIIDELLASHPQAASLLRQASHCRALAVCSAVTIRVRFAAAQAALLAYQELRHRVEPRSRHPVHVGVGLLLVFALSAGLAMLDLIELSRLLGGPGSLPAVAATAVWATVAWLGVAAVRQRRWALVAGVGAAAVLLGLLLVALHGLGPHPGWPTARGYSTGSVVFGVLTGSFILVLTVGAGALVAYMGPASLLLAWRRWHRARTAHEETVETERANAEAAAVAAEAWLGLVRTWVTAIAADDERFVQATMALAAVLVESSRPQVPPSL
jgi:hypothetical protein